MISKEEYEALLEDRPRKFGPEEVGFVETPDDVQAVCCACIHWFSNPARMNTVCEIMRLEPERDVPPLARCLWWTPDGKWYPLQEAQ